jgi:zinc finger HIT domain-containing protein 3
VKCFKAHIVAHEDDETKPELPQPSTSTAPQEPAAASLELELEPDERLELGQLQVFAAMKNDPRLTRLLKTYPNLRKQLKTIFDMTVAPTNPHKDAYASVPRRPVKNMAKRDPGMYLPGQWTQEKADMAALRKISELEKRDQGLSEFLQFVSTSLETRKQEERETKKKEKEGDPQPLLVR